MFLGLQTEPITEPVSDLVRYIAINWINGTMSPPKEWSIYGEAVQTNNDVNGWHKRTYPRGFWQIPSSLVLVDRPSVQGDPTSKPVDASRVQQKVGTHPAQEIHSLSKPDFHFMGAVP